MKVGFTFILLVFTIGFLTSQVAITGFIYDSVTQERLVGASIFVPSLNNGVITNELGHFTLNTPLKNNILELQISYVGYKSKIIEVTSQTVFPLEISLINQNTLEEIYISSTPIKDELGNLDIKTLELIPTVLDNDIIKSIQHLPGIQGTTEGQSNFIVRGGNVDQNLILIDNMPIYSPTHALGFTSSINSDVIQSVNLKKEGIPAEFGGRISSVLDISTRDGDLNKLNAKIGIGLINSSVSIDGPIKKNKTSFLFSARRTYLDLVLRPFKKSLLENRAGSNVNPDVYFYDTNLKFKHLVNKNNELLLSVYRSNDYYNVEYSNNSSSNIGGIKWGNFLGSIKWNWTINPNLKLKSSLYTSNFENNIQNSYKVDSEENRSETNLNYLNSINDISFKTQLEYFISQGLSINTGAEFLNHKYNPGRITILNINENETIDTTLRNSLINANEYNFYSTVSYSKNRFKAIGGIRSSSFTSYGKTRFLVLPRLKLRYAFNFTDFIFTYDRTAQFVNQLISSSLSLPTDIWVPAPQNLVPQTGNQFTLGSNINLGSSINLSVLGYYKTLNGVLAYKEGENFITLNDLNLVSDYDWEEKIIQGEGKSQGIEILLQKNAGKYKGFLSYTLSKSIRKFDELNQGNPFAFRYDRTHNLSLSFLTALSANLNFSTIWKYSTGIVTTLPNYRYPVDYEAFYDSEGNLIQDQYIQVITFDQKNSFRQSDYHRLDLQLTYEFGNEFPQKLVFGIYNTYFRKNSYIIESWIDSNGMARFQEVSLLPFAVPTIIYKCKIK